MRLTITKSKQAQSFYVIETVVVNGKRTTRVVEKLGSKNDLEKKLNGQDVYRWAKDYVEELNRKREAGIVETLVRFSNSNGLQKDQTQCFKGGYLFLQALYHQLKLDSICRSIAEKYAFEYDLNAILSRLLYTRILSPSSKASAYEHCQHYLEAPGFEAHQMYRALEVLAKESDFIQAELYKNSQAVLARNTQILYYDCTNYYFELEEAFGLKQYGHSKENRPNPIIQMGLFLDGSGLPLSFSLTPGNQNEQTTLKPLEQKLLNDFALSRFIVCTDAGLSSKANRRFNTKSQRAYVTTQSLKKLNAKLKDWALSPQGWTLAGDRSGRVYDLQTLDWSDGEKDSALFYKQRAITDGQLEEFLLVSFSPKYRHYQQTLRQRQFERAQNQVAHPTRLTKKRPNDPKRFIKELRRTAEGELAEKICWQLDWEQRSEEERFDGFYAVCSNLEGNPEDIIRINQGRWEIEKAFRTLKTEFRARPVYLQNDDRIFAHFLTCFIALLMYRILGKRVQEHLSPSDSVSPEQMLKTLKEMNFLKLKTGDYVPAYTRTHITDALHDAFGFRTDTELLSKKCLKQVIQQTKN